MECENCGHEHMKLKKNLKWGETPWDDLSRDDLLLTVKRMYSALLSTTSCLEMSKVDPEYPYWTKGSGAKALAKANSILSEISDEETYRAYFRYATELLFPKVPLVHDQWKVCANCGEMVAGPGTDFPKCRLCGTTMSPIRWSDLAPKAET